MSDDTEEIAAMASVMKKQRDMMKALFTTVEGKLAGITAALEAGSVKAELGAIESMLADMTAALEGGSTAAAIEAVSEAIARLNPTVTVNVPEQKAPTVNVQVNPTPVTVEAVMPSMPAMPAPVVHIMPAETKGATWEVRMPGVGYGGSDRVFKITRTN